MFSLLLYSKWSLYFWHNTQQYDNMQERTVSGWTDGWINGCKPGKSNLLIDFTIDDKWTKPHCEISAVVMNEAFLVYFNTDLIKKQ